MRRRSLALLCLSALLMLTACSSSSTTQPYTNMHTRSALSAKVAAQYGETRPMITHVTATLTNGPSASSMNLVTLAGPFHTGSLVATRLSFSMLADGSKVWALMATDDQYLRTHTAVWRDNELDIKL
jgi:hypothetical protein